MVYGAHTDPLPQRERLYPWTTWEMSIHWCIRKAREAQTHTTVIGTRWRLASCLSDQDNGKSLKDAEDLLIQSALSFLR